MVETRGFLFGLGTTGITEESAVKMMAKYFFQLSSPGRTTSSTRRGSIESCDETENNSLTGTDWDWDAGLEHEERLLQQDVTQQIERRLTEAKASILRCQVLLLPRHTSARVGQDVVRSSVDEPCGLRGASIQVYVEFKDKLKYLGSVSPDPDITPTFELSVIFKADRDDGWPPLKAIFDSSKVLKLRAEYRLVKRKLYSSASPVIHDFN
ncbi:hypothetical protein LDENG_00166240 [Lucifuga dentata]|nr:hypothetical protein LDENG_00166240 [Lucifuga dentata]